MKEQLHKDRKLCSLAILFLYDKILGIHKFKDIDFCHMCRLWVKSSWIGKAQVIVAFHLLLVHKLQAPSLAITGVLWDLKHLYLENFYIFQNHHLVDQLFFSSNKIRKSPLFKWENFWIILTSIIILFANFCVSLSLFFMHKLIFCSAKV